MRSPGRARLSILAVLLAGLATTGVAGPAFGATAAAPSRHPDAAQYGSGSTPAMAMGVSPSAPAVSAQAINTSSFRAGFILSDNNLYAGSAMSAAAVQTFLNNELSTCTAQTGAPACLKSFSEATPNKSADAMCTAYAGAARETAAQIIAKVGAACGISQKVLLVTMQKEQGLVTDPDPSQVQYDYAMGYSCPDSADGCDPADAGFFQQVYGAAWQFKRYANPPGTTASFTWHPVGSASTIAYAPDASCGSAEVSIHSQATAALYYYTPYQPTPNALKGSFVASCDSNSVGNLNFWSIYTDWFDGFPSSGAPPIGGVDAPIIASGSSSVSISGWAIDPTSEVLPTGVSVSVTDPIGMTRNYTVAQANSARSGLIAAHPLAGPDHGFTLTAPLTALGSYKICATALPLAGNTAAKAGIGCKTVSNAPVPARLSGVDRYATAVQISKAGFPSTAPVVFIATGTNYPDALSAAPAAAKKGGPLLLTPTNSLPSSVRTEIQRLRPSTIVVVGGVGAISKAVYTSLSTLAPTTIRLWGADRYATMRAIVRGVFTSPVSHAYIATGANYPDALAASAAAGAQGVPVVLVPGTASSLDPANATLLKSLKATKFTIAGGTAVVSQGIADGLTRLGATVTRASGIDRFATAERINKLAFPAPTAAYLATGSEFPDALAGAVLAGTRQAPLYVVPSTCVPSADLIDLVRATSITLLGGAGALGTGVVSLRHC